VEQQTSLDYSRFVYNAIIKKKNFDVLSSLDIKKTVGLQYMRL